jgi:hypothetical protein
MTQQPQQLQSKLFVMQRNVTFENFHKTATKGSVLSTMIFPSFLPILKFIKIIALCLFHLALRVHQKFTVLVWNFKKYKKWFCSHSQNENEKIKMCVVLCAGPPCLVDIQKSKKKKKKKKKSLTLHILPCKWQHAMDSKRVGP